MTTGIGADPTLGGNRRHLIISGLEPQLGGDRQINLAILDALSRGMWTSVEELRRIIRLIAPPQRSAYRNALLARLETADPDQRLPEVQPWRGGRDQRVRIIDSLSILGDSSVIPPLSQLIDDANGEVRLAAMAALGKLGYAEAVPALCHMLAEGRSTQDRIAAANSLAAIHSETAIPALVNALHGSNPHVVRVRIIHALGYVGGEDAITALIDVLRDKRDQQQARCEAAFALGRVGDLRGLVYLCEALDDAHAEVRRACVMAAGSFQGEIARAALNYALSDPDERVRTAARSLRKR